MSRTLRSRLEDPVFASRVCAIVVWQRSDSVKMFLRLFRRSLCGFPRALLRRLTLESGGRGRERSRGDVGGMAIDRLAEQWQHDRADQRAEAPQQVGELVQLAGRHAP